jgi:uncharacterized protein YeaO (DUF488 family)
MFKAKSVRTEIDSRKDGLRILVTRGRGRGLPKDRYDVWMANLGPSEQLKNEFLAGNITWPEFSDRYRKELREGVPSFPFSILYPPSSLLFSCQPFAKSSGVRTRRSTR